MYPAVVQVVHASSKGLVEDTTACVSHNAPKPHVLTVRPARTCPRQARLYRHTYTHTQSIAHTCIRIHAHMHTSLTTQTTPHHQKHFENHARTPAPAPPHIKAAHALPAKGLAPCMGGLLQGGGEGGGWVGGWGFGRVRRCM